MINVCTVIQLDLNEIEKTLKNSKVLKFAFFSTCSNVVEYHTDSNFHWNFASFKTPAIHGAE